jgi:VWFA-related protein
MVFDKQGHFVNNLTRDDFQLKVDGKPQPIQAFDLIKAGGNEELQLAAARGAALNPGPNNPNRPVPLDRGRTIFFYLDDFHIDLGGFAAARKAMKQFINNEMGQNDQVAIVTSTGQLGFLQQLTNNRNVLELAIDQLRPRSYTVRDSDRPPMTEYQAQLIDNNDTEVTDFFVTETMRRYQMNRDQAAAVVRGRVQSVLSQGAFLNTNMLTGLGKWVRSMAPLPGRKLVFFMSNGFLVHNRRADSVTQLRNITSAAAKNGVVIYSLDVRGLAVDPMFDSSEERAFDPSGRLNLSNSGELRAAQDGPNALARDTGGRAIFNTNDFRLGVSNALKETAVYYLLAWKPDADNRQQPGRFRNIDVSVVGRSDLTVRVRRGFFDIEPASPSKNEPDQKNTTKDIAAKLRDSLVAPYPERGIPIILNAVFYDLINKGPTISASVQIPGEFMTFGPQNGKIEAVVDVAGVFFDTRGEAASSFSQRIITTAPDAEGAKNFRRNITYTSSATIKPGLYQVRASMRDEKSGRIGSAHVWIEIPDLDKKQLAMSSLLLAERTPAMMTNVSSGNEIVPIDQSASQRFRRASSLRFQVFAYNTTLSPADGQPDVAVQIQVLRDGQPVLTTALRKINTEGILDLKRLPYAAEISLDKLNPGLYILQVSVIDRLSKQSTSQQTHFEVY